VELTYAEPVRCWLCDQEIGPDDETRSLLGRLVFIAHRRCYERDVEGESR
jgi:hypothetical protein